MSTKHSDSSLWGIIKDLSPEEKVSLVALVVITLLALVFSAAGV